MPLERSRSYGEDLESAHFAASSASRYHNNTQASHFLAESSTSHHQLVRRSKSNGDIDSVASFPLGLSSSSAWVPGQEYSHIQAYDPLEDAFHAHLYASNWKDLHFRQVFRFANCYDWFLMTVGLILAVVGSLVTPWLYYWSGVTIHDILVFERCRVKMDDGVGGQKCIEDIPGYCTSTIFDVGRQLFYKILWGWIFYNFMQLGYCVCFTTAADRQTKAMRAAYFESIVRKDMAWFDLYAGKDFAKEMTEQITHIRLGIGDVIPNFINLICTVIAMIIIVFLLSYQIAISFLCFIPFCMLIVYMGNWAERKRGIESDIIFRKANIIAKESLVNIKVIKMYEAGQKQVLRYREALHDAVRGKKEAKWMAVAAISSGLIWLLLNVATAIVFWLGQSSYNTYQKFCQRQKEWGLLSIHNFVTVLVNGGLDLHDSPGEILVIYFGLTYIILHASQTLPNFLSLMQIAKKNATGVFFIIDWKSRIDNTSTDGKTPKRSAVGRLDFNNVSFRYPQKPEETVLNIRQLTIYGGQFIAFAGPANSGKNTILKLIPRLYDVCSGFIALDAVNVQNYNIHWLRKQICMISEAPVIFTGTISENILFGKLNANEEEIIKACQLADLHHVIEKLPNGYNTKITGKEFGDLLTRNEKRQLCLARAYLHRSRVILMDNPLAPEDDLLEPQLLRFVHHFRDTATVILASSNVTALSKRADCIYYMEQGHILEYGTHIQLIQARGKYYNRLEGTVNCSVESRNKIESQLKAYKISQLLHKKRKSSLGIGVVDSVFEQSDGATAGVDETQPKKKHFWNNLTRSSDNGKLSLRGSGAWWGEGLEEGELVGDGRTRGAKKSKEVIQISNLEETYSMYSGKKTSSGGGSYMHNGFSMMGFQRINFSRPMTNYSTQIHKQRRAFFSYFENVGSQSLSVMRKRKFSHFTGFGEAQANSQSPVHPEHDVANEFDNHPNSSRQSGAHVTFSFSDTVAHDRPIGIPSKKETKPTKSKATAKFSKPQKRNSKSFTSKTMTKGLRIKNLTGKSPTRQVHGSDSARSQLRSIPTSSILRLPKDRPSFQDALENMTDPASFHINEHVEIDNVSILTEDLDSFLAAYDEGVYSTMHSNVKGYWRDVFFVTQHDWTFIIPAMIASIIIGMAIPYQGWIVGTYFQTLGNEDADLSGEVRWLCLSMLIVGVITAIAAFIQEFFFAMAGTRMTRRLRERLFAHLLTQDLTWFDAKAHDIGILTYQLYADTTMAHYTLLLVYGSLIQAGCNVVTSVTLAAVESSDDIRVLTVVFIIGMPILIVIVYFSSKKELTEAENLEERFRVAGDFAQEFIVNIKTWFSLGAETFFISQHKKILDREYTFIKLSSIFITCLHTVVQTSSWLIYAVFLYFASKYHNHEGLDEREDYKYPRIWTKPSLIGFIMIATELLIFGAYRVGDQIAILTDVEFGKVAAHKIMRILVNQPETDPPSKTFVALDDLIEKDLYRPPPEIGLTNITYFYPGTDRSLQEGHLNNISMTIASSSYVAVVGPPSSGKSTLCNIILRMCNPTTGILDFNGDDLYDLSPKLTRRLMGLVEYDPCLLNFSILENIRLGDCHQEADQVVIEEATKLSNCHYDILDLANDYETLIHKMDKTAQNFSLKQRIAYARALLRKPKILLIDDATTSTSIDTDHKLLQVIANVREGRTLVVFSHKIEPVRDADVIYVLWGGKIVESGTDKFLLQKKGYYYEMYMTQKVLADTMRNSPQQLSTIRYNIKNLENSPSTPAAAVTKETLIEIAAKPKPPKRHSSIAFVKFLNEKVGKLKAEKEQRRTELDQELPMLEEEEKEREKKKVKGKPNT